MAEDEIQAGNDAAPETAKHKSEFVEQMKNEVFAALVDKKAADIEILDVRDKSSLADYFVIATARSTTHARTLADGVEENLKSKLQLQPRNIEGMEHKSWILLDYVDVVVHIMTFKEREYYDLDRLWR